MKNLLIITTPEVCFIVVDKERERGSSSIECNRNLDSTFKSIKMVILGSILTTFKVSNISRDSWVIILKSKSIMPS